MALDKFRAPSLPDPPPEYDQRQQQQMLRALGLYFSQLDGDVANFADKYTANQFGFRLGSGGTVTQATSKSTAVTLDKITGEITMHNAALAAATIVSFTLNNGLVEASDQVVCTHHSGGTIGAYTINGRATGAGTAQITIRNNTAGSLGEAVVVKFAVIKTVAT